MYSLLNGMIANDLEFCWRSLLLLYCNVNLCNTYNSGNIARFNYSVFTHKLESSCSLWFKLYCHSWRTSQGYRQSLKVVIPWKRY